MADFTREQYDNLPARQVSEFKEFLLRRFCDYTKFTKVTATTGWNGTGAKRDVGVVERPKDSHGWGGWTVDDHRLFTDEDYFHIMHYLNDERLPTSYGPYVQLPKAFVFGEIEADEDYQTYLRLKERFEGNA